MPTAFVTGSSGFVAPPWPPARAAKACEQLGQAPVFGREQGLTELRAAR